MITLTYLTNTVSLRNPRFGDTRDYAFRDLLVKNRYDEVRHIALSRQQNDDYSWSFTTLKDQDVIDLVEFMKVSRGQIIQITDYNAAERDAIITIDPLSTKTVQDDCSYSLELTFKVVP